LPLNKLGLSHRTEDQDQDLYEEPHHKFIEGNKQNWKSVRAFDTYVK
jgi:hypothetical protein